MPKSQINHEINCKSTDVVSGTINLSVFNTNANSVVDKMDELRERIEDSNIIEIVETWATENISDAELKINVINMFRLD